MSRIFTVSGGALQGFVQKSIIVPEDLVLYTDVAGEIGSITVDGKNENVVTLALGQGETVPTLIAKVKDRYPNADKILTFFQNMPAITFSLGMGMQAPLGRMAIELLRKDRLLYNFLLSKVFDPVFEAAGATLNNVKIISFSSLSGGTGGGVSHAVMHDLLEVITDRSQAVCECLEVNIGGITYNGLGKNIFPNAGVRLVEKLTHVLAPDRKDREIRKMWLVELPPLGNDKPMRDHLAVQFVQALFSKEVQRCLNIIVPNVNNKWDGVKLIKAGWWNGIYPYLAAACRYNNDLREFTESLGTDLNVCQEIRVQCDRVGSVYGLVNLQDAIKNEHQLPSSETLRGNLVYLPTIWVHYMASDEKQLMDHNLNRAVRVPQSLQECREIMEQYRGLIARIETEQVAKNTEYTVASNRLKAIRLRLEEIIAARYEVATGVTEDATEKKKGLWEIIKAWWHNLWHSAQTERNQYVQLLQDYLQQIDTYYRLQSIVFALENALRDMRAYADGYQDRLRRLDAKLELIRGSEGEGGLTFVEFQLLDRVFRDLIELSEVGKTEAMKNYLDSSVKNVTLRGLGAIVGLSLEESQVFNIVSKLRDTDPPHIGPDWGGKEMLDQNSKIKFWVFPPMAESLAKEIREMAERLKLLDGKNFLAFCDSNAGGINIISLDIHKAENIGDIITPMYVQGLKEALGENPELYHLPDVDISGMLAELGIPNAEVEVAEQATNAEEVK